MTCDILISLFSFPSDPESFTILSAKRFLFALKSTKSAGERRSNNESTIIVFPALFFLPAAIVPAWTQAKNRGRNSQSDPVFWTLSSFSGAAHNVAASGAFDF
jgi:hypothetical protein